MCQYLRGLCLKNKIPLALVLTAAFIFGLIEARYPLFFLEVDNRDYFYPLFSYNADAMLHGKLPQYNFHQFLGVPHLSSIQPAPLYPPIYVAFYLSRLLHGDYLYGVDILVVTHFMLGMLGVYYLLSRLGLSGQGAFLGAITWPLSSFLIYRTAMWWVISPLTAYFPWMILLSLRLGDAPGYRNATLLAVVRTLLFYSGYPQYFVYGCIFEFATAAALFASEGPKTFRRYLCAFAWYLGSYILVLLLSMPLLLPGLEQAEASPIRNGPLQHSEYMSWPFYWHVWIPGLIFLNVDSYGTYQENVISYLAYQGLLMPPLVVYAVCMALRTGGKGRFCLVVFALLAVFSFMWASNTALQEAIYGIPLLNRFRWPIKVYFFTAFYLALLAAWGFEFISDAFKQRLRYMPYVILALQVTSLVCVYLVWPHYNVVGHFDNPGSRFVSPSTANRSDLEYNRQLDDVLREGRVFSFACGGDNRASLYTFNYATLKGVFHFAGYEPLLDGMTANKTRWLNYMACLHPASDGVPPVKYLRKWGVRWYVVGAADGAKYGKFFRRSGLALNYTGEDRLIYYDGSASPMFFWEGGLTSGINANVGVNAITVSTNSPTGGNLVVNWLYRPYFKGSLDGVDTPVSKDGLGRILVQVPSGRHELVLEYSDPNFIAGLRVLSAFLALTAAILVVRLVKKP